jgi:hypothetical protein
VCQVTPFCLKLLDYRAGAAPPAEYAAHESLLVILRMKAYAHGNILFNRSIKNLSSSIFNTTLSFSSFTSSHFTCTL